MRRLRITMAALILLGARTPDDAAAPVGEPVLEPPTFRSLGVYWIIRGDQNGNARIDVDFRKSGEKAWSKGAPLFRVERGPHRDHEGGSRLTEETPAEGWLFAGSLILLDPATSYEIRLKLSDPDGGSAERLLKARTIGEPTAAPDLPVRHVSPGEGGGNGTPADPYRGLAEADRRAQAGDVFLVHAGSYAATAFRRSGEPGKPIVWRAAGDGEAVVGGTGAGREGIRAEGLHDVWFEGFTVRNKDYGFVGQESGALVIRRCHFEKVRNGIYISRNARGGVRGWWISDNVLEGVSEWPRPGGKMDENEWRGVQLTGAGHVVAFNRVHHFKDAIDTFPSGTCAAIDFHNNDVSELNDDGFELDYSERNVRCFENRIVNVHCGVSTQPVYGGPVYVFRNAIFNVTNEPLKMHNSPSGVIAFHNTSVRKGMALQLYTSEAVHHCILRNNLFVGTSGPYAFETTAPMVDCDFDYDGFAGGPWTHFLKWNEQRYATLEEMKAKAPVYRHAVRADASALFASGAVAPADPLRPADRSIDLRLAPGGPAVDAGEILPGLNDGFTGAAPDLGAFEVGLPLPPYGPRPERR